MPAGFIERIVNGPVRRTLEWAAGVGTIHPSLHRLKNALGLTVGMAGGRYIMDRAVGETPDGETIDREDVPFFLRPLHKKLAYDHYADGPTWNKAVDMGVPAVLGGFGAYLGSHDYALEQPQVQVAKKSLFNPKALTLDIAEDAAMMLQGETARVEAGAFSVFGSSSMISAWPGLHYSSSLGRSFFGAVRRNKLLTPYFKPMQEFISGNKHDFAFGPSSMLPKLRDLLVHNPAEHIPGVRSYAYAVLEPWFGNRVTEAHIDAFLKPMLDERAKLFKPGGVPAATQAEFTKHLNGYLSGAGLEKHLMRIDLNPATAMLGRNGFMESMAHVLGAGNKLREMEDTFRRGVMQRHGLKELPSLTVNEGTRAVDRAIQQRGFGAFGAMWLGVGFLAYQAISARKHWREKIEDCKEETKKKEAVNGVPPPPEKKPDTVQSKVYSVVDLGLDMLNAPTSLSLHRTACALGLTVGGYIGTQVSNAASGRTLTGAALPIEQVPELLRGIYKKTAYNPHSHLSADRWKYILHFGVPAIFAAGGVVAASEMFFRSRKKTVEGAPGTMENAENRSTMAQANTWTPLTAVTALMVTPSGMQFLPPPLLNYAYTLHTRFMLAAGRKGIFPGLGEVFTGTTSKYPQGPVALRDRALRYMLENEAADPRQVDELARGIVLQWFPDATPQQVHAFTEQMLQDREKFYVPGEGIPEHLRGSLTNALAAHFKGPGLEQTFRKIGLDPMQAVFGSNGLSATIAKACGAKQDMDEIREEYISSYTDRLKREQQAAPSMQLGA